MPDFFYHNPQIIPFKMVLFSIPLFAFFAFFAIFAFSHFRIFRNFRLCQT